MDYAPIARALLCSIPERPVFINRPGPAARATDAAKTLVKWERLPIIDGEAGTAYQTLLPGEAPITRPAYDPFDDEFVVQWTSDDSPHGEATRSRIRATSSDAAVAQLRKGRDEYYHDGDRITILTVYPSVSEADQGLRLGVGR